MKKFNNLGLNDKLYRIKRKFDSNQDVTWETITIFFIIKEDKSIKINERRNYNTFYDIIIPSLNIDNDTFENEDYLITTNKDELANHIRDIAINQIQQCEDKINNEEKRIREIREKYWNYLQFNL